jgi:hypothetical protein
MGKNINSGNYMQVVPNEMIDLFTNLYSNPDTFSKQPTKMLWGQPGIGKSQAVGELAKHLEAKTHKKVVVTTASLLLMSPIDLRGIPTKDTNADGYMVAKWLTAEISSRNRMLITLSESLILKISGVSHFATISPSAFVSFVGIPRKSIGDMRRSEAVVTTTFLCVLASRCFASSPTACDLPIPG